jgi:cob(I)alamin adenosyltransferase
MRGLVQIYTGNGKGKTTASIGQAVRSLGHGRKVCMLQFMKGDEKYGELQAVRKYCPDFVIEQCGLESFVDKKNPSKEDISLAQKGLEKAKEIILEGKCDLIILDEINVALDFKLVKLTEVVELLCMRPHNLDLILTGRYCPKELYAYADLVSEIQEVKHHYQVGVDAREGIEY